MTDRPDTEHVVGPSLPEEVITWDPWRERGGVGTGIHYVFDEMGYAYVSRTDTRLFWRKCFCQSLSLNQTSGIDWTG